MDIIYGDSMIASRQITLKRHLNKKTNKEWTVSLEKRTNIVVDGRKIGNSYSLRSYHSNDSTNVTYATWEIFEDTKEYWVLHKENGEKTGWSQDIQEAINTFFDITQPLQDADAQSEQDLELGGDDIG